MIAAGLLAAALHVSCPSPSPAQESLLFRSGFEGATRLDGVAFKGDEPGVSRSDWLRDIESFADPGRVVLNFGGGDSSQRSAAIVPEPGNEGNRVLRYRVSEPWATLDGQTKARVQLDLYGIRPGLRDFSQSVRMRLSPSFAALRAYPRPIHWLTIFEFWNNEWWVAGEKRGFRITVGIGKARPQDDLAFFVEAEDAGQVKVWRRADASAVAPIGRWFAIEFHLIEGDERSGRFRLAITPEGGARKLLYDVTGFTHATRDPAPDGVTGYNPMKLYTSRELVDFMRARGESLDILWDDLAIWRGPGPFAER